MVGTARVHLMELGDDGVVYSASSTRAHEDCLPCSAHDGVLIGVCMLPLLPLLLRFTCTTAPVRLRAPFIAWLWRTRRPRAAPRAGPHAHNVGPTGHCRMVTALAAATPARAPPTQINATVVSCVHA